MKKEYDFSNGTRGAIVSTHKKKITIRLDESVIEYFKQQVEEAGGGNYQSNINAVLKEHIQGIGIVKLVKDAVKQAVHDEMKSAA